MRKQKLTKHNVPPGMVRIAANIDREVVALMDRESKRKGQCSRAAIIRMALVDRYLHQQKTEKES